MAAKGGQLTAAKDKHKGFYSVLSLSLFLSVISTSSPALACPLQSLQFFLISATSAAVAVAVAETEAEAAAIVAAAACAQLNVALAFENAQHFLRLPLTMCTLRSWSGEGCQR